MPTINPFEEGLITVALGGSKLLSAFVQKNSFYTAQNVAVLRPRLPMTFEQKVYVCLAIRQNRFRYSAFGREANRTLRTIPIPDLTEFPAWIGNFEQQSIVDFELPALNVNVPLESDKWKPFALRTIFDIRKGQRLTKADMCPGDVPYIGASDAANGVTARIGQEPIHQGGTISVSYNGSVAEAFFQPLPYWATDDINVLYPKGFQLTASIALFICTVIRLEKYRFNYGRKWHLERMRESIIKLPVTEEGMPDFEYMDNFMKSLRYSSSI